jgi:hypothetical protein
VSFEKMWDDDGRWIRTHGFYADYLGYWREAFPDFGVFFYDDIKDDPVSLIRSAYSFVGVDETFSPQNYLQNPRKGQYDPIPSSIRQRLADFYRTQILRFSEMTGRDLKHWIEGR